MTFLQIPLLDGSAPAAETPAEAPATLGADASLLKSLTLEDLINNLAHTLVDFAIHLAIAILVFYVGKFIIRRLYMFVTAILVRRKIDKSLATFVLSLIRMVLYFILVVTVIGILGINTSSFIAIFASAGVAVGMALSGTLQNFAGGVLILLLKPYKVGDYIEAQGYAGTVTEIQIFSTIICTYDNKSIIIPNGGLSTSSVNNWSREEYRRIDWDVSLAYGDDFALARTQILKMFEADPRIVKTTLASDIEIRAEERLEAGGGEAADDPEPKKRGWLYRIFHRVPKKLKAGIDEKDLVANTPLLSSKLNADRAPKVFLKEMAESSINLTVRAWALSADYWAVYFDYNERFYAELPEAGFHFPFPQLDVHVIPDVEAKA